VLSRTSIKFNVSVFSSNLQPLHFAFPWRGCLFHNSFTLRMDFTLFATLDWVLPCPSILLDSSLCISWRGCLFHNSFTLRMDFTLFTTLDWDLLCPSILLDFSVHSLARLLVLQLIYTQDGLYFCSLHLIGFYCHVLLFYWTLLCAFCTAVTPLLRISHCQQPLGCFSWLF